MNDIRELTFEELDAVSGGKGNGLGSGGLLGQIEDLLTGSKDSETHERKHGLIEELEAFLGLQ